MPPGPGNPRNSEGAFLTLENGDILFAYSRYSGTSLADEARADIAVIRSRDGGETWSEPRVLFTAADAGAMNLMSVSMMRMANGDVGMFYLIRRSATDLRLCLRRSADEGETWSEPVLCMDDARYYVVNNDRVVRLSDGRILIPAALHLNRENGDGEDWFDSRGEAYFFASDDDGRTFRRLPGRAVLPGLAHSTSGMQEPGVTELAGGVLWCYARTDLGRQYECFSLDGGCSWTTAQPSAFTGPCSPLSVKRAPDGTLAAVYNPIPEYNGRKDPGVWIGGRTPLVLSLSRDDGKTWSEPAVLEDDPGRGYCYCAIHFTAEAMLLAYCSGGDEDGNCLARLTVRKLSWPVAENMK